MKLLATADVLVTNMRQSALQKLGVDYQSLAVQFPRLVYAMLTGYGLKGPERDSPGYDIGAFWARSGAQDIVRSNDNEGTPPARYFSSTPTHQLTHVIRRKL
jgi:cinnamoyl-CoA:phenyllactate CoA-transferase